MKDPVKKAEYIPCDVRAGSGRTLHTPIDCEKKDPFG